MKKTLKLVSLLLVGVMVFTFFTGCSNRKKGDPPVWTDDKTNIMVLGGYNVKSDFYKYLFLNTKTFFDDGDEGYWQKEGNGVSQITDYVLNSLKETYGMFALADEYEITLTKEDKEYVSAYIEESKQGMTNEEYIASLEKSFLTEDVYRFVLEVQQLEYLVYEHLMSESSGIINVDDATLEKALDEEFVRATHILFTYENEEERKAQLEKANQILEKLKNGEDFETLKEEYSADTDLKGNKDGYYFTHGEFKNEFEYTAFDLEVGEISEVITTDVGYHIVKRLPIEDDYVNEYFEELRTQYKTALYYKKVEEKYEQFTFEYEEDYKSIQLDTFN
ncbi:MAG: peptidylprolyl isomerase [Clostridia bacterium]|nr:peptidylprolyl isomerase [Clostridia bacterium]